MIKTNSKAKSFYVVERYTSDITDKRQFRRGWYIADVYETQEEIPQEYRVQYEITALCRVEANSKEEASVKFIEMSKEFWGDSFIGYANGQPIEEAENDRN